MDPLRYHTEVHLEENTSHALVVELVGRNKRVLDVGCATGAIGKVLTDRGCLVVGVEPEGAAAEVAKQVLAEVLIGTIDELDLPTRYAHEPFDVIIVADVLEHLVDPLAALTALTSVLTPGGSIIASIPNVAHGDVRLALLQGRFDYTDVGLLDRTHVHFFTKETVEQLFDDAGLSIVDLRRTTADVFATEIPLRQSEIDPEVVQTVLQDPEATTYQFVVKAVPGRADADSRARLLALERERLRLHELEREVVRLRGLARPHATALPGRGAQIGLWGYFDTRHPADELRLVVHRHELGRRLPDVELRAFAPFAEKGVAAGGTVVESLGESTQARHDDLIEELDAVIVTGSLTARADEIGERYGDAPAGSLHPGQFLARMLPGDADATRLYFSDICAELTPSREDDRSLMAALARGALTTTSSDELCATLRREGIAAKRIPDTIRVVARAFDRRLLDATLAADPSSLAGERYLLIRAGETLADDPEPVLQVIRRLATSDPDVRIVAANVDGGPGEGRCTAQIAAAFPDTIQILRPDAEFVSGLVANAWGVASDAPWLLCLAQSFQVPSYLLGSTPGFGPKDGAGAAFTFDRVDPEEQAVAEQLLRTHFDDLAEMCRQTEIRDRPPTWHPLARRLDATERAFVQQTRVAAECLVTLGQAKSVIVESHRAIASAERRASLLQEELLSRNDELAAIHASKLWRYGNLARRIRRLVDRLTP